MYGGVAALNWGEFEYSQSSYGTFDQGGNVWEWNEAIIYSSRGVRGGSFGSPGYTLHAQIRRSYYPTGEDVIPASIIGFRIAEVPEPATIVLLFLGSLVVVPGRKADCAS